MLFFVSSYLVLQNSTIQTIITNRVSKKIFEITHAEVQIGKVSVTPFGKIVIENLYLSDPQEDTLLYVRKINAQISAINVGKRKISFSKLICQAPYFKLISVNDSTLNLDGILDSLENKDTVIHTDKDVWKITFRNSILKDGRFVFLDFQRRSQDFGMNYDDLDFREINTKISNIQIIEDSLTMHFKNFSCKEKGGLIVKDMETEMCIADALLRFDNTKIDINNSRFSADHLIFNYTPEQHSWRDFTTKVRINYKLRSSDVYFKDLAFFNPIFAAYEGKLQFSGDLIGTIRSLSCREIVLKAFENTELQGNFYLNGLPYFDNTYIDARLNSSTFTIADLEKIHLPNFEEQYYDFPERADKLGRINYQGNFTGFFNNFVCFGNINTALGDLKIDLKLSPAVVENNLQFKGFLQTFNFDIGTFIDNQNIGMLTVDMNLLGELNEKNELTAELSGTIVNLDYNGYTYKNITTDAIITNKKFNGKLALKDPNIDFNFDGWIDFSESVPTMKYKANIFHAKLFPLHLHKDKNSLLSTSLVVDLSGSDIDSYEGKILFSNTHFKNSNGEIFADKLTIEASSEDKNKHITLRSPVADVNIKGNVRWSQIPNLFNYMTGLYLPSYLKKPASFLEKQKQLAIDVQFKTTNQLSSLFNKYFRFDDNTCIKATYSPHQISTRITSKDITFLSKKLSDFNLIFNGDDKQSLLNIEASNLYFNKHLNFRNFSIKSKIANDEITSTTSWYNNGQKKEILQSIVTLGRNEMTNNHTFHIHFPKQQFQIEDKDIVVNESTIFIDSTHVAFKDLRIGNNASFFRADGNISRNPKDKVSLHLYNIPMASLSSLFGVADTELEGNFSGNIDITDLYRNRIIQSDMKIDSLIFNNEPLGNATLQSSWKNIQKSLIFSAHIPNMVNVDGTYFLNRKNVNMHVDIDNAKLKAFEPYFREYVSHTKGNISGNIEISGKTDQVKLSGKIKFNDVGLRLVRTKADYTLNDEISIVDNVVILNNFNIEDKAHKKAVLNGKVKFSDLKNPYVDVELNTDNFNVLNSQANELVFGKANVSGNIQLKGNTDNVDIKADISTDKNSKIGIDLGRITGAEANSFMTFVNPYDTISDKTEKVRNLPTTYSYDYNLKIPQDTKIELNFSSQIGNTLTAKGIGNLNFSSDKNGNLIISGEYQIVDGKYQFSLLDVVSRKFNIQEGGIIKWNGDPYSAFLDIKAIYKIRTSISNLLENRPDNFKTKTLVHCILHMTEEIENPLLKFSIEFPNLDIQTVNLLRSSFPTEEEVNKQVLSLLLFNRFYTPKHYDHATDDNNLDNNTLGVTANMFVSRHLSRLISQISDDFDVGVIYIPDSKTGNREVGLALSTQLLNNRVIISSNLNWASQNKTTNTQNNEFTGDVDVKIKIDKRGKLLFKVFTREDDNLYYYEDRKNTQGVGLVYRESFDSFKELINKYIQFLTKKNK